MHLSLMAFPSILLQEEVVIFPIFVVLVSLRKVVILSMGFSLICTEKELLIDVLLLIGIILLPVVVVLLLVVVESGDVELPRLK